MDVFQVGKNLSALSVNKLFLLRLHPPPDFVMVMLSSKSIEDIFINVSHDTFTALVK